MAISQTFEDKASPAPPIDLTHVVAHFQPIYKLPEFTLAGFEALARKPMPDGRLSAEFLAKLDKNERPTFDLHILNLAAEFLSQTPQNHFVSVNLYPDTLAQPDLIRTIDQILKPYRIEPECLKFEILETPFDGFDMNTVLENLRGLKSRGHLVVLDDYLSNDSDTKRANQLLPFIDGLKIDGVYLNLPLNARNMQNAIIQRLLQEKPALQVTLERVEIEADAAIMNSGKEKGLLHLVQGWGFSAALSPENALKITNHSSPQHPHFSAAA